MSSAVIRDTGHDEKRSGGGFSVSVHVLPVSTWVLSSPPTPSPMTCAWGTDESVALNGPLMCQC